VAEDIFRFGRTRRRLAAKEVVSRTASVGENIHPKGGDSEENLSVADE